MEIVTPCFFGDFATFGDRFRRRSATPKRGIILFVVVIVIAMLSLGGIALLGLMRVEREATFQRLTEIQLAHANRSAVVMIQGVGELSVEERNRLGGIYDNPNLFCNGRVLSVEEGAPRDVAFTILSPKLDRDSVEGIRYGLVNESARLNLGAVLQWESLEPGTGRAALMKLPGMTETIADSILDWIDPDERPRSQGAESDWYARQRLPYSPRNALPVFLEELLLVRGVTRELLFGEDPFFNFGDAAEKPASSAAGGSTMIGSLQTPPPTESRFGGVLGSTPQTPVVPWARLMTVFSAERDVDPNGDPRIDLNGNDLGFLFDELSAYVSPSAATFAVLYRQYGPVPDPLPATTPATTPTTTLSTQVAQPVVGVTIDRTRPAVTRLATPWDLVGAKVFVPDAPSPSNAPSTPGAPSTETGKLYASPFADDRRNVADLAKFLDYASTAPATILVGRVNIHESPRVVLEAVPGLDTATVQRILNARPRAGESPRPEQRHALWLYADGIVDLAAMKKLWPKITTEGGVFRAQVVSFIEGDGASARGEVVVDSTVSPPRQVFYKDLTMYGRGFSLDTLTHRVSGAENGGVIGSLLRNTTAEASPFLDKELAPVPDQPFQVLEPFRADPYAAGGSRIGVSP